MKKFTILFLLFLLVTALSFGQNISSLEDDVNLFFNGLGSELLSNLMQSSQEGLGIGTAEMGDDFIMISGTLGTLIPFGYLEYLDDPDYFNTIDFNNVLTAALGGDQTITDLIDFFQSAMFVPFARVALGLSFYNIEGFITFSILPKTMMDWIFGLAGLEGISVDTLNIGTRFRYVLVDDEGSTPAFSIGIAYQYSGYEFSFAFPEPVSQDLGEGSSLLIDGTMSGKANLHAIGIEAVISKRWDWFALWGKLAPWYRWSTMEMGLSNSEAPVLSLNTSGSSVESNESILTNIKQNDMTMIISLGFDMNFNEWGATFSASYDIDANTFGFGLGSRIQF